MFTGIIEEIGTVKEFILNSNTARITVECDKVLENTKIGDSIAINGVCQTVVNMKKKSFTSDISAETLKVTNFQFIRQGDKVNLERAMSLNERIGGHVVLGHVDSIAKLDEINKAQEFYELVFELTPEALKYVIQKGSITINGVSLTVADINDNKITVAIIPHTFENTNFSSLSIGRIVNIETDVFAKYIEKFILNKKVISTISEDFLKENGFA
ncbi:riboflavin synthase [bacterium]|nr:riboflavin synthase [bacterium]